MRLQWLKRLPREQLGMALLEVIFALGILGVIGTGILSAMGTNSRATGNLAEQVVGVNLATTNLESIKQCPYADTYPNDNCLLNNISVPFQYTVSIDTDCSADGTTWLATCAGETLQKIAVSISREGTPVHSLTTYRSKR